MTTATCLGLISNVNSRVKVNWGLHISKSGTADVITSASDVLCLDVSLKAAHGESMVI